MMFLFSAIILIDFTTGFVAGEATAIINTTSGPVRGEVRSTVWHSVKYASFRGIKFAQAPLGHLRFKPPVPVEPWTETLDATAPGAACVQLDRFGEKFSGSEDCLFLNVFTPVINLEGFPASLKAVMVWLYGGAWIRGSSTSNRYNPDFLLERNVVVVTINYRLGALGFLNLNHPNATGNAGLKDQRLAFKWIQANIEKFGGNPNNVTIFGDSAGAVSVGFHILSEGSAGLFHGAISMSGTPLVTWGYQSSEQAVSQAENLGRLLGTFSTDKETLLQTFYDASAEELARATISNALIIPFAPTYENANIATDVIITECSVKRYLSGNFSKIPQMIGFMREETATFVSRGEPFFRIIRNAIEAIRSIGAVVPQFLERLIDSAAGTLTNIKQEVLQAAINETTDIIFISPIDLTQQILVDRNGDNPIYYYCDSFYTERNLHNIVNNSTLLGAGHTDGITGMFYVPFANYSLEPGDPRTRVIHQVTTMWTNFAKYGNPTPHWTDEYPLNVTWPPSAGRDGVALDIDYELTVIPRPTNDNVKMIQALTWPVLQGWNGCE